MPYVVCVVVDVNVALFDVVGALLDTSGLFLGVSIDGAGIFAHVVDLHIEVFSVCVDFLIVGGVPVDVVVFFVGAFFYAFCFGVMVIAVSRYRIKSHCYCFG